jgi:N-acetyl-gamma-glutamyl-phosphate reductase
MSKLRVAIVGASGYSGSVAVRLVAAHERLALVFATSDKLAGEGVGLHLGTRLDGEQVFLPNSAALDRADACEAVILATAADVSMRLAPELAARGKQIVDLSGAFRLDAAAYPRWYGFEHSAPTWLDRAHYGLPELFGPPSPASIVANPGCYPTAALLALVPLLRNRLIEGQGIVVDAKSGVTGAGRQSGEAYSFAEVDDDLRAYRLLTHQHTPEIELGLVRSQVRMAEREHTGTRPSVSGEPAQAMQTSDTPRDLSVTFTAHLLPIKRGLLATCYARPAPGANAKLVAECLAEAYVHTPFVRAVPPEQVMLKRVVGTNLAYVGATANASVVVTIAAIDNLLKGAAGQAIQNLNAMNGWPEITGLDRLQRVSP